MLLLLTLFSSAAAAPYLHFPYYQQLPYYNPYTQYAAPAMSPVDMLRSGINGAIISPYPIPSTRLVTWSVLQDAKGTLQALAAGNAALLPLATATTVTGNVEFQQNPLTGTGSTYKMYLNNVMANMKYDVQIADDCSGTNMIQLEKITTPWILINGVYIAGATNLVNVDGMGTPTSVRGKRLIVRGPTNNAATAMTVVGCTNAVLA